MPNKYASYTWPFLFRKIILLGLIAFLAVISVAVFFGAKEKKINLARPAPAPAPDVQSLGESFTAFESSAEEGKIKIRADLASIDREDNQQLRGNVEFFQEKLDFKLALKTREATVSPGREELLAAGSVEVETGDLKLSAPRLTYKLKSGLLQAEDLKLTIGYLEVSAPWADYDLKEKRGRFQRGAVIRITGLKPPLMVRGENMDFDLKSGLIRAAGVELESSPMSALAPAGIFLLDKVNFEPVEIKLEGKSLLDWRQKETGSTFSHLKLASDKINLCRQEGNWAVRSQAEWAMKAEGSSREMEGSGEEIELVFEAEEKAAPFLAWKAALVVLKEGEKEIELQAEKIKGDLVTGKISLHSSARLISTEFNVEASSLEFELSGSSFLADRAKLEINPSFFRSSGLFFSKDRPMLATGREVSGSRERIDLSGQVTLWQGENIFLAGRAALDKGTEIIEFTGSVKASLAYSQAKSSVKKAEISARELTLLPGRHALQARQEVKLSQPEFNIQAKQITFYFEEQDSDELTGLEIGGLDRLSWHEYEFSSKEAIYRPKEEAFVFRGQATMKDDEGNLVEADKLTLFTLDDKITVEIQGRKRSVTILRRGK